MVEVDDTGLYCPRGGFYIDPWRPAEQAIITHAHADHARPGSSRYWAARSSESALRLRLGHDIALTPLEYGERIVFGDVTVSLHPAGHVLGSAQVRLEADGQVWVVTGDYKRDRDPSCEPFEPVSCDVLVTEATFGLPVYRWPDPRVLRRDLLSWWRNYPQGPSILFCYAFGKTQRILAELSLALEEEREADVDPAASPPAASRVTSERPAPSPGTDFRQAAPLPVMLHGASVHLTEAYRNAGVEMLPTVPASDVPRSDPCSGRLIIAPPSAHRSPWMKRFPRPQTAFASGWMQIRGNRRRRGYERGFVVSDHIDWSSLIRTIRESGAHTIYVTHGQGSPLVRYIREELGLNAWELSTLYEGESE